MRAILLVLVGLPAAFGALAPSCNAGSASKMTPGLPYQLDGSASVANNGDPALRYWWQQVAGHSQVLWSSQSVVSPVITGIVGGAYRFRLTVTDSSGKASTCTVGPVGVAGKAGTPKAVSVGFRLAAVPGAVQARCSLLKHDATLATATSAVSPCIVQDDSPNPDHYFVRLEYLSAGGKVLASSDSQFAERKPVFRHNWYTMADYMLPTDRDLAPIWEEIQRWKAERFEVINNAQVDPRPYNPDTLWITYLDHMSIPANGQLNEWRDIAARHGFDPEALFIHGFVNNTVAGCRAYLSYMDQFDIFENGKNGVLLWNGSAYTDLSGAAYYGGNISLAGGNTVLIGYSEPFDEINFTLVVPAAGAVLNWQYWNGSSYGSLNSRIWSDSSGGLTRNGTVRFTPPADWARHAENGSYPKYWVKLSASGTVRPTIATIKGDSWVPGDGNQGRGWAADAAGILNKGLGPLEYNPNPPLNAQARFRHQARVNCGWSQSQFFPNFTNMQLDTLTGNTVYAWGQRNVDILEGRAEQTTYSGVMLDNAAATPFFTFPNDGPTESAAVSALLQMAPWEVRKLHADLPGFQTWGNSTDAVASKLYDYTGTEDTLLAATPRAFQGVENAHQMVYDNFAPAANPNGTKISFMCLDTSGMRGPLPDFNGGLLRWHPYESGNLGPMNCLAMHYLLKNENTGLSYAVDPGFYYPEEDEYYYFAAPTTLTAPIVHTATSVAVLSAPARAGDTVIQIGAPDRFPAVVASFRVGMTVNLENAASGTVCAVGTNSLTLCAPLSRGVSAGRVGGYFTAGIRIPVASTVDAGQATPFVTTPPSYAAGDVAVGMRIGDPASGVWEEIRGRLSNGVLYTDDGWSGLLRNDYPAGTPVSFVKKGHQSTDELPAWSSIYRWGIWYPAMGVDVGTPDPNGYSGGALDQHWLRGYNVTPNVANCNLANVGGDTYHCADVQRRDYTNAIVLFRAGVAEEAGVGEVELDVASRTICLPDGSIGGPCSGPLQYYRLYADGTTGPATNSIQLRAGEGVILMRQPVVRRIR